MMWGKLQYNVVSEIPCNSGHFEGDFLKTIPCSMGVDLEESVRLQVRIYSVPHFHVSIELK